MTTWTIRKMDPRVFKILGVICDHVLVNFVLVQGYLHFKMNQFDIILCTFYFLVKKLQMKLNVGYDREEQSKQEKMEIAST